MSDTLRELVPAAPPAAVGGAMWAGITFSDLVLFVTFVYTVVQLIIALPRLIKTIKDWKNGTGN